LLCKDECTLSFNVSMVPPAAGPSDHDCACLRSYGEGVDSSELFIIVALVWALLGVSMAVVMGRRGHQPFMWLVLGIVFGPLVLPLAANALRHDEPGLIERLSRGSAGTGSVDVLVGIDGSAEAVQALRHAVDLLRWRIGRLTLATVLDYDVSAESFLAEDHEKARGDLIRTADATSPRPETIVLSGRPAEALRKYAVEEAYDVIVVGRRGHGPNRVLLGSVASELARGDEVPVLIV
jgi:nucleotide-binding universal stress UspA family protein